MSESFTVILDLPPPAVHQNMRRGGHWARKRDAIRLYRDAACMACLARGIPASCPWAEAAISMAFYFPADGRKRDLLNYVGAMKPAIDGIQHAGIVADDSGIVLVKRITRADAADTEPYVLVHLERIDEKAG